MASANPLNPCIDIKLSFCRPSHPFSQGSPPGLTLTLTSYAETPVTLFTFNTPSPFQPLSRAIALLSPTLSPIKPYRQPPSGPIVPLSSAQKKHQTNSTYTQLSTGFGRGGGAVKPQPKAVVERGYELDDNDNERNIRRSRFATDSDGLEPGHTYVVGLNEEALRRVWWTPVPREDVLVDGHAEGSYVQDYEWEKTSWSFTWKKLS